MKRVLVPSFIATVALASACGGGQPKEETPISANPPAPDGSPGIGDGAGPPPAQDAPADDAGEPSGDGSTDEAPADEEAG